MTSRLSCTRVSRRFDFRSVGPLTLMVGLGLSIGCSSASSPGTTGTGGKSAGTGGGSNPGSGGSGNLGSGGSVNPGTGGSGNPGSGGSGNPGSGGSGNPGTGGSGNPGTGGSGNPGTGGGNVSGNPPGYWTYPAKMWGGCSWTGIDALAGSTTTNMPKDFLSKAAADPYCVKGTVFANYDAVALLGFNLAEPPTSSANQCAYKPVDVNAAGPPSVTLTGTGIAVSFSKKNASELRIQVQGPNGGKAGAEGAADRWCFKITPAEGPVFAPYTAFNSKCWDGTGTAFNPAVNKVSAVVFLVPGAVAPTPFDYCIGGFNTGSSTADAPPYMGTSGPLTGTIGGAGATDNDFKRVKVAAGGKSYIIQNNNWGNPTGSDQTLMYTGNSFKITSPTGGSPGNGVPASYPSIFIGGNGDTQMGTYSTRSDDGLPKQISAIGSINSTFRYNTANGDYNAAYDIWLSATPPTSRYDDGIAGFVMIWLYKPGSRSPIGSVMRSNVSIPGAPGTWDVWVGPRGSGANPNRPVVSYVAKSTITSFMNVNIKPFLSDAAMNGIPSNWYLTDVFGGFEIWSGSGTMGLEVQEFTAVVQ
ncbi:MAG: hypothetical protein ABI560_07560 [Myxococcales bacterium]